jgi:hypothetical protein
LGEPLTPDGSIDDEGLSRLARFSSFRTEAGAAVGLIASNFVLASFVSSSDMALVRRRANKMTIMKTMTRARIVITAGKSAPASICRGYNSET